MRASHMYAGLKIGTWAISLLCILNLVVAVFYSFFGAENPKTVKLFRPQRILIFAAHQDDCVIQGGGVAIQNSKLGGATDVVYLTIPSNPTYALIRKQEAQAAWEVVHDRNIRLSFLDFESSKVWSNEKKEAAKIRIAEAIDRVKPEVIYVPLNEGGHPEHDLLNLMVLDVANRFSSVTVVQSAEYNPYYIMKNAPTKVLWFLVRLLPFVPFDDPNVGLEPSNQTRLRMSREELGTKVRMLMAFESQRATIPIGQFGYEDLFETSSEKPKYLVKVDGKYFSSWAFITLSLVFLMFFLLGSYQAVFSLRMVTINLILIVGLFSGVIMWLIDSRLLMEESLYWVSYFGGLSLGLSARLIGSLIGEQPPRTVVATRI